MSEMKSEAVDLTKDHIRNAFKYLEEVKDLDTRNIFFNEYMVQNVTWEVAGPGHAMSGIRHSVEEHTAASFARLRVKIIDPIKFVIRSIILDTETRSASVELFGYATKLNGEAYNNDYVWLTQWNDQGKIVSVRSYHDTKLADHVLFEEF